VDDDPALREMLRLALEDEGHTVDVAADGRAALDLLQQGHYRVLLLDMLLPGLDGFAVLARLRAEPALRPSAVLVLSALQQRTAVLAALEAGADDYLTKPFDLDALTLRVDLWLRRVAPAAPWARRGCACTLWAASTSRTPGRSDCTRRRTPTKPPL
jgi:DNA-binding response OmpR family regulator